MKLRGTLMQSANIARKPCTENEIGNEPYQTDVFYCATMAFAKYCVDVGKRPWYIPGSDQMPANASGIWHIDNCLFVPDSRKRMQEAIDNCQKPCNRWVYEATTYSHGSNESTTVLDISYRNPLSSLCV